MPQIPVLTIRFHQEISPRDIPLFRGAVIDSMENANVLFHNHEEDSFRYSYPLIQYKRIAGKAAIVCVGEGVEHIGEFFAAGNFRLRLGQRMMTFDVADISVMKHEITLDDNMNTYRLNHWLPLNQENHEVYEKTERMVDRCALLERMLIGNILSFAKNMDVFFTGNVACEILSVTIPRTVLFKGVRMLSFDAVFKSNVSLPYYIGLGKGVSIGHGVISKYVQEPKQDRK